ncbi:MAG: hypothetical protein K9H48_12325 [Melioribacteraceae bacterium]|nr:hypothetical protein [Melioribacteraceae bacterium]MCF8395072.1 hypothetical protein [Melioribacteraceae bacterium]MCF8420381.1 hypothetical protein [Melioribacteraceae bacterium]
MFGAAMPVAKDHLPAHRSFNVGGGSIRQTYREGNSQPVTAQDYLPYGGILREYNNVYPTKPDSAIVFDNLLWRRRASPNERYKFTACTGEATFFMRSREKEHDTEIRLRSKSTSARQASYDYFACPGIATLLLRSRRARYYDSDIGRWLSVDPLADSYPGHSPYNYCLNNPINNFDPNGASTYTDSSGTVIQIINDDKTDIYRQNAKGGVSYNGNNYELMGQSTDVLSFAAQDNPFNEDGSVRIGANARIDFGSFAAGNMISKYLAEVSQDLGGFIDYAMNAGDSEHFDIKYKLGVTTGSQISAGIYASGRDAGYILAGMAANKGGLDYITAMTGFGSLQMAKNNKTLGLMIFSYYMSKPFGSASVPNFGESPVSHRMQTLGYLLYK